MAAPEPVTEYILTEHARFEMFRRGITEAEVAQVLSAPEQSSVDRPGRNMYQSRISSATTGKTYLLRIFVDVDRQPAEVVSAYRTSKLKKYWRRDEGSV